MNKEEYMRLALNEAKKAYKKDEVPVGAIIVMDGKVIAKAHNLKETKKSPLAHAEIECIKKATKYLNSKYLDKCEMYVTLEPCLMCTGAIINSRIKTLYFGAFDKKGGAIASNIKLSKIKNLNHYPKVEKNILLDECSTILKKFFKEKRIK